jgi:glycosyltransferase involved in cell wall biosynthesis
VSAPTVTAIVPVFNGRRYLRQAVESVAAQTAPPAELIVVDDGSTDGSLAALDGFAPPFPVRVLRQPNAGQSAARNHALRQATGELVAFLDQDDLWQPRHLERLQAPFTDQPEVAWTYSDFDEIDDEGRLVTRGFLREHDVAHPKGTLEACLSGDLLVLPSASVLRRAALLAVDGFDEELSGYEDDELFVRIFRAGWEHVYVPERLTRFRIHGESSSVSLRFLHSRLRFTEKLISTLPAEDRLGRRLIETALAPRFFFSTLDEYVRACSARDWARAREAAAALRRFAALRRPGAWLRLKLTLARSPRLFRLLLALNERLPGPLGWHRNPIVRLRHEIAAPARTATAAPSPP